MKSAATLEPAEVAPYESIRRYDLREIDNADVYAIERIMYTNRLGRIVGLVNKLIAPPAVVIDWGCAQGNASLLLAELGYSVVSIDLRREFLEYAKLKYEKGRVRWVVGNMEMSCLKSQTADVVLLCEVLEHCAYPEDILAKAGEGLKSGGFLVATTPNGKYIRNKLPTFEVIRAGDRREISERQFGPDGPDHLFALTLKEMRALPGGGLRPLIWGYLGSAVANVRWQRLLRKLPVEWIYALIRLGEGMNCLNAILSPGLYCVYVKE